MGATNKRVEYLYIVLPLAQYTICGINWCESISHFREGGKRKRVFYTLIFARIFIWREILMLAVGRSEARKGHNCRARKVEAAERDGRVRRGKRGKSRLPQRTMEEARGYNMREQ